MFILLLRRDTIYGCWQRLRSFALLLQYWVLRPGFGPRAHFLFVIPVCCIYQKYFGGIEVVSLCALATIKLSAHISG